MEDGAGARVDEVLQEAESGVSGWVNERKEDGTGTDEILPW